MRKAITVASNAPWAATGYGQQTSQLVTRLHADGIPVCVSATYGLDGTNQTWNGIPVFGRGYDIYSNDSIPLHSGIWAQQYPDHSPLTITLFDVWVFQGPDWQALPNIASWVPIDHSPIPGNVEGWLRHQNVTPIAMSRFGERLMLDRDIECAYIPHAVEKAYQPTDTTDIGGEEVTGRMIMGIPEDAGHVTMIAAANKGVHPMRKCWAEMLVAWSVFADTHKDAWLYLHTELSAATGGIDLRVLLAASGAPMERVKWVNPVLYRTGLTHEAMASLYTAADVLLATSAGEGFGIPVVEAQRAGTPVIVSDFSAQPELVKSGWTVKGQAQWNPNQQAWLYTPFIGGIKDALVQSYGHPRGIDQTAIDGTAEYDADFVYATHWRQFLEMIP